MSQESWEKYVKPDPGFSYDTSSRQAREAINDSLHTGGENLRQEYDHIRSAEVESRNRVVFSKIAGFYLSRKGILLFVISIVLCLVTSSLSLEGVFFWNLILAIIVWVFFEMTTRTKVRPEWNEVWDELEEF